MNCSSGTQIRRPGTQLGLLLATVLASGTSRAEAGEQPQQLERMPAFTTLDLSMSYSGFAGIKLSAGVANVGGRLPPFELNYAQTGANYLDNLHGRRLWLRAAYSFR